MADAQAKRSEWFGTVDIKGLDFELRVEVRSLDDLILVDKVLGKIRKLVEEANENRG